MFLLMKSIHLILLDDICFLSKVVVVLLGTFNKTHCSTKDYLTVTMETNLDWEFPFLICHPTYKSLSDSSYIKRKTKYTYLLINEVAWSSNFVNIIVVNIRRER